MDSEDLLQCPYDKNHMIRPSRFPYHLVKCRENNKSVAKVLAICPYNARHRVPKKELDLHMQSCESKCPMDPLPDEAVMYKEDFSTWQSPPCAENWEDESSSCAQPAFVLNGFGNNKPYSADENACKKSPPRTTYGPGHGGYTNAWKPVATSGTRAACNPEPAPSYEVEWPSLSNHRHGKERRQYK
ncbi:protein D7-like isoform X2 [Mixophyes fleayi]